MDATTFPHRIPPEMPQYGQANHIFELMQVTRLALSSAHLGVRVLRRQDPEVDTHGPARVGPGETPEGRRREGEEGWIAWPPAGLSVWSKGRHPHTPLFPTGRP